MEGPKERVIHTRFWIGDIVYLKVRDERVRGIVCSVDIRPTGVAYAVQWGDGYGSHYEIELADEYEPAYE